MAGGITTLLLVTSGIVVAFHDSGALSSVIVHLVLARVNGGHFRGYSLTSRHEGA